MGKVAIIRDIGAITCVPVVKNRFPHVTDGSKIRGNAIFPLHWRDKVLAIQFRSSPRSPCTSKDRRLEHGETTISVGKVRLSSRGQGDQPQFRLVPSWLIKSSTIYQSSRSELRHSSTITWSTATSWRKYFPTSLLRKSPPRLNRLRISIFTM